jgi:hypothetical protein
MTKALSKYSVRFSLRALFGIVGISAVLCAGLYREIQKHGAVQARQRVETLFDGYTIGAAVSPMDVFEASQEAYRADLRVPLSSPRLALEGHLWRIAELNSFVASSLHENPSASDAAHEVYVRLTKEEQEARIELKAHLDSRTW